MSNGLKCGHNRSYTRPWSDNEECLVCGETTYETSEERVVRLRRRVADLRAEVAQKESEALEHEAELLERQLDPSKRDEGDW